MDMITALYYLQDTISDYSLPEQRRGLYQQANGVINDLATYQKFLLTKAPRRICILNTPRSKPNSAP